MLTFEGWSFYWLGIKVLLEHVEIIFDASKPSIYDYNKYQPSRNAGPKSVNSITTSAVEFHILTVGSMYFYRQTSQTALILKWNEIHIDIEKPRFNWGCLPSSNVSLFAWASVKYPPTAVLFSPVLQSDAPLPEFPPFQWYTGLVQKLNYAVGKKWTTILVFFRPFSAVVCFIHFVELSGQHSHSKSNIYPQPVGGNIVILVARGSRAIVKMGEA